MNDLPPPVPIEVIPYREVTNRDLNIMAQQGTKKYAPWWWNKHGCEGTHWYGPKPCRDLTND